MAVSGALFEFEGYFAYRHPARDVSPVVTMSKIFGPRTGSPVVSANIGASGTRSSTLTMTGRSATISSPSAARCR
jgi:hypothetical protein